jgi:hypothetical protein
VPSLCCAADIFLACDKKKMSTDITFTEDGLQLAEVFLAIIESFNSAETLCNFEGSPGACFRQAVRA